MAFQYDVLPTSENAKPIRIATLLPTNDESSPIRCELKAADLVDKPKYIALSYVWGDSSENGSIFVGEQFFPTTTANLEAALRHIRSAFCKETPLSFWADALCINQNDQDERGQQVQMMRDVFQSAERVILWLGEESDQSDSAMDLVGALGNQDYNIQSPQSFWHYFPHLMDNVTWYSLNQWCQRPVWTRIWVCFNSTDVDAG
jgi:Heterokaryon incompatibility protein (HET)